MLVAMFVVALPGPGAQAVERMGAWEVSCEPAGAEMKPAPCRASQRQTVAGSPQPVFAMTALMVAGSRHPVAIISVPSGGYLAPGIEISVDGRKPFRLLYETCKAGGCHAGFALEGQVLASLEKGRQAKVRVWTSKSTPVDVKVPLEGFSKAVAAIRAPGARGK
ncbi:invasion associated locus B family protein [Camelimonas sp. ID_303_24]